ncbi:hypothetical protein Trisim1_002511 [Trichoderma cf. simile WF8]
MAPLICRVVDIFDAGVKGVRVFLDCRDRFYKCVARLDAVTGEDGWICEWLPTTPPPDASIEPQIMDTADFPGVSMTFISPYRATLPWLSFRADLYLAGMACHGIVLRLEDNPQLEYLTHSATGPTQRQPGILPQSRNLRSPSPFQLPPALSTPPSSNVAEIGDLEVTREIAAENLTNRKRKLKTADEDEFGVARRRLV